MIRRLRQAAAAGLAACALGLLPAPAAADAGVAAAARAELREARKVEHAWMSDPRVFGLGLVAHADDDGIEVRGKVADEATRKLALRLARQATTAPVRDRIMLELPVGSERDAAALRLAAIALIRERLGAGAAKVEVVSAEDGIIELHGTAASLDERHAASRCLRNLPGITRVESYLDVVKPTPAVVQARAEGPRAEGPKAEPRELPTGPGALVLPAPPPPRVPAAVPANSYVRIQTRPTPIEPAARPVVASAPVGFAQPAYPGCVVTPRGVQLSVAQLEPTPTFLGRFTSLFALKPRTPAPAIRVQAVPPAQPVAVVQAPLPVPAKAQPPALQPPPAETPRPAPVHVTAWPPAHRSADEAPPSVVTPAGLASGGPAMTGPLPPPPPPPALTAGEPPPLPAAVVKSEEPPVLPGAVKPAEPPTPPAPRVLLTGGKKEAATTTPAEIHRLVVKTCGKKVRQVQATLDHQGKLLLQIHSAPKAEQEVAGMLLTLPELQGGNVHIQIHVAP